MSQNPQTPAAAPAFVYVENREPRIHGIALQRVAPGSNLTGLLLNPTIDLKPGINKVPADLWGEAKKNPMVALQIQSGVFVERQDSTAAGPTATLVAATYDRDLLLSWLEVAPADLVPAIQAQLKRISPKLEDDERAGNQAPVAQNMAPQQAKNLAQGRR